jgi:hypothetical protein
MLKKEPESQIKFSAEGLIQYCDVYQHDIFISAFSESEQTYKATKLADLSGSKLLELLVRWIEEQKYPYRIIRSAQSLEQRRQNLPHE